MSVAIAHQGAAGSVPFGEYAACYDLLYRDKDYAAEAAFVSGLIGTNLGKTAHTAHLLDLACGTGRHIREFARLGYDVEGSDAAASMIAQARTAATAAGLTTHFYNETFQTCDRIGRQYDVALALFASLNYLTSVDDLSLGLRNIRSLLSANGIFIFDMWNGDAVVRDFSPRREKRVRENNLEVVRVSETVLNPAAQTATVDFHFTLMRDGKMTCEFSERHPLRYYYLREMNDLLRASGMQVLKCCPFMFPDRTVEPSDWNVTYVVRKSGACANRSD